MHKHTQVVIHLVKGKVKQGNLVHHFELQKYDSMKNRQ